MDDENNIQSTVQIVEKPRTRKQILEARFKARETVLEARAKKERRRKAKAARKSRQRNRR